ncbi:MAG TPA: magnesium/cobalt transporter CorA [Paludibacter sp.]|nr:magnesium/cobalt transporter CorA [Paludibacter sp.]
MSRFIKKKKEDIGLSPYAIVFRGQKKTDKTEITVMDFDLTDVREFKVKTADQLQQFKNSKSLSWLNVDSLHDVESMQEIAEIFEIPDNILSDILNPSLRPKVQEFDKGIFATIKMLQYNETENLLSAENLSLIIVDNVLISFQEQPGIVFDPIRERIRKHKNKIRTSGSDYLAFTLLDVVVDNYIYIIGLIGDRIETLEIHMTNNPNKNLLEDINFFKGEMNFMRKNIKPAKEMILTLAKMESEMIHADNKVHYKELQDNINETTELSDSYRDILYDQITMYHTMMSTKLNDIMRTLTVYSVIFIPLTFIVGIYGTNFDNLPELHWKNGYFIMWGVMIVVVLGMLWFFKRKKWF